MYLRGDGGNPWLLGMNTLVSEDTGQTIITLTDRHARFNRARHALLHIASQIRGRATWCKAVHAFIGGDDDGLPGCRLRTQRTRALAGAGGGYAGRCVSAQCAGRGA
jgi:hypothetical protein